MTKRALFTGIFLLLMFSAFTGSAQKLVRRDTVYANLESKDIPFFKKYRTWDLTAAYGMTLSQTDLASWDNGKAFCITGSKFVTSSVAIRGEFLTGKLRGRGSKDGSYRDWNYYSLLNYQASITGMFQLSNFSAIRQDPKLALYGYAGVGVVNSDPYVYRPGYDLSDNYKVDDRNSPPFTSADYKNKNHLVLPVGLGFKYRVKPNMSLMTEFSFRYVNDDQLDGFDRLFSANDAYSLLNAGVVFHLGKAPRVLQWSNPMKSMEKQVKTMRDSVQTLRKDTDKDGVPDIYDKEPDTPAGMKVFADGMSVTSDSVFNAVYIRNLNASIMNGEAWLPYVFFDQNSAKLSPKYDETLASVAIILVDNPSIRMEIIGNTDTQTSKEYNLKLGQQRADAVKERLVKEFGIDSERLVTRSEQLDNNTSNRINLARRVDFKILH